MASGPLLILAFPVIRGFPQLCEDIAKSLKKEIDRCGMIEWLTLG